MNIAFLNNPLSNHCLKIQIKWFKPTQATTVITGKKTSAICYSSGWYESIREKGGIPKEFWRIPPLPFIPSHMRTFISSIYRELSGMWPDMTWSSSFIGNDNECSWWYVGVAELNWTIAFRIMAMTIWHKDLTESIHNLAIDTPR